MKDKTKFTHYTSYKMQLSPILTKHVPDVGLHTALNLTKFWHQFVAHLFVFLLMSPYNFLFL